MRWRTILTIVIAVAGILGALYRWRSYLLEIPDLKVDLSVPAARWIGTNNDQLDTRLQVKVRAQNKAFILNEIHVVVTNPEGEEKERIVIGRSWPEFEAPSTLDAGESWSDDFRYKEFSEGDSVRIEVGAEGDTYTSETLNTDELEERGRSPVEPSDPPG